MSGFEFDVDLRRVDRQARELAEIKRRLKRSGSSLQRSSRRFQRRVSGARSSTRRLGTFRRRLGRRL